MNNCNVEIKKPSDVIFVDVNSINKSDYDTVDVNLNIVSNNYTLFPTVNPNC